MKTPLLLTLAATLCLALAACVPTSECPLSAPGTSKADPKLLGDWFDKNDQETYRVTAKDGAWMHLDVLKAGTKIDSYDFYPTQIGNDSFANTILTNKDNQIPPPKAYTFVRYSVTEKGTLKIWSLSPEGTAAAVRTGRLQGSITEGKSPEVFLTGSDVDLTKFIETTDLDKLFTNETTLTKIK